MLKNQEGKLSNITILCVPKKFQVVDADSRIEVLDWREYTCLTVTYSTSFRLTVSAQIMQIYVALFI